jgi:hypothetical protein
LNWNCRFTNSLLMLTKRLWVINRYVSGAESRINRDLVLKRRVWLALPLNPKGKVLGSSLESFKPDKIMPFFIVLTNPAPLTLVHKKKPLRGLFLYLRCSSRGL